MYGESLLPHNMVKTFMKLHFDTPVCVFTKIFKCNMRLNSSLILSVYLSRCNQFTNLLGGSFRATLGSFEAIFGQPVAKGT